MQIDLQAGGPAPEATLLTVGHGNRTIEAFVALLGRHRVEILVDVRSHPVSRRYPWFDGEVLRLHLDAAGVRYHFAGRALGGRRRTPPRSMDTALADGLRGFADHMRSASFRRGAAQLVRLAQSGRTAIMCAERDPAHCHRSLIADHLHFQGIPVGHIDPDGSLVPHRLHPSARPTAEGVLYDRHTRDWIT